MDVQTWTAEPQEDARGGLINRYSQGSDADAGSARKKKLEYPMPKPMQIFSKNDFH